MKWRVSCKETTTLVSRAMDERLSLPDRLAVRMHLSICRNCARFARQLQEMRRLFQASHAVDDATTGLSDEARQRIEAELQKKLGS